ncbi:unnamed protein product [Rotaria sp. Silwood2]|nr:unnamed protein product [Rotaria sp. Silwood2]
MKNILQTFILGNSSISLISLIVVLIYFTKYQSRTSLIQQNEQIRPRGVFVILIRSTNRSVFLTINMIHSVIHFYPTSSGSLYPFIIFHDEAFTSAMRQQILSCVLRTNKQIQISFALVNFQTSVKPNNKSRLEKSIGYRLMCRFWIYDVFYHPIIRQGNYDYLMRMDDDSYFSNVITEDLFLYLNRRNLDYIYRSIYLEPFDPMHPILRRFIKKKTLSRYCIYNNFFVIRLKWYYESEQIKSFVHELIQDDLILREYIGDGCIHSAMLEIDKQVKVEHVTYVSYGHNLHVMPLGYVEVFFHVVNALHDEMNKSCQQLIVLQGIEGKVTRIEMS